MNKKDLDILLNKFYDGETTLDEEQLLRQALAGDGADHLLMQALDQMEDKVEVPADLEMSLSDKIDEWEAAEHHVATEHRVAKVSSSFWKRTAWAAAASVAVMAAVGWWLMRDGSGTTIKDNQPEIIAKVEETEQDPSAQTAEPENDAVIPEKQSQPQRKGKLPSRARMASDYKNTKMGYLAQNKTGEQNSEPLISEKEEEMAIAALAKFSTILNKGMDQLNNADEKMNEISNTVQQLI